MKRTYASTSTRFPGEDTAYGQWPRPRVHEWQAATAGQPKWVAFWPPLPGNVMETLCTSTVMPPMASDRTQQTLLLVALQRAAEAPRYELVAVERSHWLTETLDAGELAFWCRKRDQCADVTQFPWRPDDELVLFSHDSLLWGGRIRIERVAVNPAQGRRGAAATGYITARPQ